MPIMSLLFMLIFDNAGFCGLRERSAVQRKNSLND